MIARTGKRERRSTTSTSRSPVRTLLRPASSKHVHLRATEVRTQESDLKFLALIDREVPTELRGALAQSARGLVARPRISHCAMMSPKWWSRDSGTRASTWHFTPCLQRLEAGSEGHGVNAVFRGEVLHRGVQTWYTGRGDLRRRTCREVIDAIDEYVFRHQATLPFEGRSSGPRRHRDILLQNDHAESVEPLCDNALICPLNLSLTLGLYP